MDPIIDLTFLKTFTGGSNDKIVKYVNMFLQHAPNLVSSMEQHLAAGDYPSLKSSAHSLKPQISYMGIKSAEELIKTIENNSSQLLNLEQIPTQITELKSILDKAYPELKKVTQNP